MALAAPSKTSASILGGEPSLATIYSGVAPVTLADTSISSKLSHLATGIWGVEDKNEKEKHELRRQISDLIAQNMEGEAAKAELQAKITAYERAEKLGFLLSRISTEAAEKVKSDSAFEAQFVDETPRPAFVISADIRKSTELMLKAKTPALFAAFMSRLYTSLKSIVISNYGVFDKFTGDGILAFLPEFYSGKDAAYRCLLIAHQLIEAFDEHYRAHRSSFTAVMLDVGLGVGIDCGDVSLLPAPDGLTVVGEPVVYACRHSAAPAGRVYANEPAHERICREVDGMFRSSEREIKLKDEERLLAYDVELMKFDFVPALPEWRGDATKGTKSARRRKKSK